MKIHDNLQLAVADCLKSIFQEAYYADKVIERKFKSNRQWGSRDRKFIAEAVYDIVRWKAYLEYLADTSIEDSETILKTWLYCFKSYEVNLDQDLKAKIDSAKKGEIPLYVRESFPEWLYTYALEQIGDDWHSIASALNRPANLYLRTNTLKINRDELISTLAQEGIEAQAVLESETAIIIPDRKNVFQTKAFKNGFFEVQDVASQLVCPNLKLESGMRMIDACAGAGGKALHAASLMQNKGKIIALDIHEKKLAQLKIRARRNSVDIIESRTIDSSKTIKRLKNSADALLLDVPCSGLGVLRRNPDSKWKLTKDRIGELMQIQSDILSNYSTMLKSGGRMVYATCSLLPSENQEQVAAFLNSNQNFKLLDQKTLRPDIEGYDGFYFAVLERL